GDNADAFPNDASESVDSDGDGVGDNADVFPNDANESGDGDGDGVGDNADQCPATEAGAVVDATGCLVVTDSDGDGVADANDQCPNENASAADEDGDGCLDDDDGDGVLNDDDDCPFTDPEETVNADGCSEGQLSVLDDDNDGVSNLNDLCPNTAANVSVDTTGCAVTDAGGDEGVSSSLLDAFFSGDADPVTTTVGIGAILIALFGLLQTNAVAALLPETFRWVQVLRNNTKLTKEEENELTYLQSLTQAYHANPQELADELEQLRGDLTARYTNNEIKKQTREKLMTLIDDLLASTPEQLNRIAHNDAYFGLAGAIDTEDRTQLLNEKLAMAAAGAAPAAPAAPPQAQAATEPAITAVGVVKDDGYEWLEWPEGSSVWYYRRAHSRTSWSKWQ
ncbi:MAG: thrombospondin type 3 repeat-containing protein, partial [Poseidonia sp.]